MPKTKYYVETGSIRKVLNADDPELAACLLLVHALNDESIMGPLCVASEAGFMSDLLEMEMADAFENGFIFNTAVLLKKLDCEDVAEVLMECVQENPPEGWDKIIAAYCECHEDDPTFSMSDPIDYDNLGQEFL